MSEMADIAGYVFVDPSAYADEARFEASCALLRKEDPVHWVEGEGLGFNGFWAITKHADVFEIETKHQIFLNAPRPLLGTAEDDRIRAEAGDLVRTLIHVDEPEHRKLRGVTSEWFLPKNLSKLDGQLGGLARRFVDRMLDFNGECDFARDVCMQMPLNVILSILGLPETDYDRMLKLTQEMFGSADEEMQRGGDPADLLAVVQDFLIYFSSLTEARRAEPTDDLASAIANATVDGDPLAMMDTIGYYIIAATAGHDTTSSAMAGGMLALIQNPDQLARLQADPSLMATAADEMIRWTTPVKHFMRTATVDYELRGRTIKAGQSVLLSYPSANRDEDVFENPYTFDIGRSPNKHLSFGFGVHYCLGAMLARMELKALFAELLPRLRHVELNGDPALMKTVFVGGLKRLPIRFDLAPALA
ncbi:MAG: cytochrome P450 [Actinomycetota bacterium]